MTTATTDHPFPVALEPSTLMVAPHDAQTLLAQLSDPHNGLGELTRYLGALHVGLLALLFDLGALPAPERLRSSRDISTLVHSLADLESLGLAVRHTQTPGQIEGSSKAMKALLWALKAHWTTQAQEAAETLSKAPLAQGSARGDGSDAWRWMRILTMQIAARGVRLTRSGQLHLGDLRSLQNAYELPSEPQLGLFAEMAMGLEIVMPLDNQLLIGDAIDLLDLPPPALAQEVLRGWITGRVVTDAPVVLSLLGLLQRWSDPLREALAIGTMPRPNGKALYQGLMSDHALEPCSALLDPTPLASLAGQGLSQLALATERHRAGLLMLLAHQERMRKLPWDTVAQLVHAQASLDLLERPCAVAPLHQQYRLTLVASATRILPFMKRRTRRDLPELVQGLLGPHGLIRSTDTHLTLLPTLGNPSQLDTGILPSTSAWVAPGTIDAALPDAPQQVPMGQGQLIVQPTGEVLAPPDTSIHVLLHLVQGAQIVKLDQMSTFSLTRRSLMRVTSAGMHLETWADMLADLTRVPLPATILQLIDDVARRQGELTLAPAGGVLIARDPIRLAEVLSRKAVAEHVILQPSPTVAVLGPECDLQQLAEQLGEREFSVIFTDQLS